MYQVNFFFHDELVKAFNAQTHLGRVWLVRSFEN
jgi:hypothetical protein